MFLGSASGIADGDPSTARSLDRINRDAQLDSVASAGDVNGDGYDDVIVGAHCYDAGETDEGAAFIFLGSASGIADGDPGAAAAQLESDQAPRASVSASHGPGDVNDDGYDDAMAWALRFRLRRGGRGSCVRVPRQCFGNRRRRSGTAAAQLESDQTGAAISVRARLRPAM